VRLNLSHGSGGVAELVHLGGVRIESARRRWPMLPFRWAPVHRPGRAVHPSILNLALTCPLACLEVRYWKFLFLHVNHSTNSRPISFRRRQTTLHCRFERPPSKDKWRCSGVLDYDARPNIRQIAHDTIDDW